MKTRSKLLLAAVSLLTVSVAATATSAYAWYTANRQVSGKVTQMAVQATSGTLAISHNTTIGDSFSVDEVALDNDTFALTGNASGKALTDVSSSGDGTFIKPKFSHDNTTIVGEYAQTGADTIGQKTVKLSSGVAAGESQATEISAYGVISLAITISNSAASGAGSLDIYIDPTTTRLTSTLDSVQKSARFSILNGTDKSLYMYCSPTADSESTYNYISKATGSESTTYSESTITNDESLQDKGTSKLFAKNSLVSSSSDATKTKPNGYLCTLDTSTNNSKDFIITMWVEGTDKDCVVGNTSLDDSLLVSDLSLSLGLYALEA